MGFSVKRGKNIILIQIERIRVGYRCPYYPPHPCIFEIREKYQTQTTYIFPVKFGLSTFGYKLCCHAYLQENKNA
jgi:hypothetical protein